MKNEVLHRNTENASEHRSRCCREKDLHSYKKVSATLIFDFYNQSLDRAQKDYIYREVKLGLENGYMSSLLLARTGF